MMMGSALVWGCAPPSEGLAPTTPSDPSPIAAEAEVESASIEAASTAPSIDTAKRVQHADDAVPARSFEAQTLALPLEGLPSPLIVLPGEVNVPLVVAAHGAGGSPEWQCQWLQALAGVTPLALACLRGKPMLPYEGAFYYPEHHTLGRMFTQTLQALEPLLRERGSTLHTYAGYSQGATMGALMLHEVQVVPRGLLLVEGGYEGWTDKRCRAFHERGGQRVYFACGTNTCAARAKQVVKRLQDAGVQAQYGWARGAGHTPGGAVAGLARRGLEWLLSAPDVPMTAMLR